MNFLRSGLKTFVGGESASSVDGNDLTETIERLVNRLLTATLPDDRRDALRALRSLSKSYRLDVGQSAMSALLRTLRMTLGQPTYNQEVDALSLALETLKNVFGGVEELETCPRESESRREIEDELNRLTSLFLDEPDGVSILLKLIGNQEFPVRVQSVRLLTALLSRKPKAIQEILLENHASIPKVIDLLQDVQEVIRNDAVLLLCELTEGNASIQKIVAFHSGFERLLNIVCEEANSVIAEDCLYLMLQLLNGNPSNVQLFRENSLIHYLQDVLMIFLHPEGQENGSLDLRELWTPQVCANVTQLLLIVRALVSPSNPGELVSSCQKAIKDCGLLYELCTLLLSGSITVDVLTNLIVCVAETVRGNQTNQDFLENVMAPSVPQRPVTLILLMSMLNRGQVFALRVAALYCFQCYLYRNERGKHSTIQTLLPSSTEEQEMTPGHLICSGLVSTDPLMVWLCSCVLAHCLYGASAEQERLLRVQLARMVGEAPITLMEQVTGCLLRSSDFQTRIAFLMLLSAWLAHCPLAVGQFLLSEKALSYLLGMVRSQEADDSENLLKGMSAFLLGICVVHNDGDVSDKNNKKYNKQAVLELINSQLGSQRFIETLESVAQSEGFAAAARKPYLRVSCSEDLVFDHEFTKLFRSLESSICRAIGGNSSLTNGIPAAQADMHDRIVDEYKRLIKQQDEENGRLRARVQELEKGQGSSCNFLQQKWQALEELCSKKATEQQLDALAEVEKLRSEVASLNTLLQQRNDEVKFHQQNSEAWGAYVNGHYNATDISAPYQAQMQQLTSQLDYGWHMYEQQSKELARLSGENARLKAELNEAKCSLQLCELKLTEASSGQETAKQSPHIDYAALSREHELLLELLSDQDQKIKELKGRLKKRGVRMSSDEDEGETSVQNGPSVDGSLC